MATKTTDIRSLIDKKSGEQFVPMTHTKAVIDDNGNNVDMLINELKEKINLKKEYISFNSIVEVSEKDIEATITNTDGLLVYNKTNNMFLWQVDNKFYSTKTGNTIVGTAPKIGQAYVDSSNCTWLGTKNKLVIQESIKSINGESLLGEGNITITPSILYDCLGNNTDGAITQKTATDELDKKTDKTQFYAFEDTINKKIDDLKPTIIENNVTNLPDNEDLESTTDNKLRFKNRMPKPSLQMGYVILRENKTFKEQVEGITDTIFEIRYNFTLSDEVSMGKNCILKFDGGKLSNGTLVGNDTIIEGKETFDNTLKKGTFKYLCIKSSEKGIENGIATLDNKGKLNKQQLPEEAINIYIGKYIDEITFTKNGENLPNLLGNFYVDFSKGINIYMWNGEKFILIFDSDLNLININERLNNIDDKFNSGNTTEGSVRNIAKEEVDNSMEWKK